MAATTLTGHTIEQRWEPKERRTSVPLPKCGPIVDGISPPFRGCGPFRRTAGGLVSLYNSAGQLPQDPLSGRMTPEALPIAPRLHHCFSRWSPKANLGITLNRSRSEGIIRP